MNININRRREDEILCTKLKRSLTLRKANKNIFVFLALGIMLSLFNKSDSFKNDSFSASTLLGMIFFGFALILYYQNHILKDRLFHSAINALKQHKDDQNDLKVVLNDEAFSIQTLRNYHRYYWKAINMFRIYKGYIILLNDAEYYTSFIIKKSELSEYEFDQLYNFLKNQRLREL